MNMRDRLRPADDVAGEVIDGEAIILNVSNGMYYSLSKAGGLVWEMVAGGHSPEEIVGAVLARYRVAPRQARADVERVIEELLEEKLIQTCGPGEAQPPPPSPVAQTGLPYEPPELNKYSDMGDLLALDPPAPGLKEISWRKPGNDSAE
jgi:hypothetical protein